MQPNPLTHGPTDPSPNVIRIVTFQFCNFYASSADGAVGVRWRRRRAEGAAVGSACDSHSCRQPCHGPAPHSSPDSEALPALPALLTRTATLSRFQCMLHKYRSCHSCSPVPAQPHVHESTQTSSWCTESEAWWWWWWLAPRGGARHRATASPGRPQGAHTPTLATATGQLYPNFNEALIILAPPLAGREGRAGRRPASAAAAHTTHRRRRRPQQAPAGFSEESLACQSYVKG